MSRVPLSDESLDLDDDVIEEEGSPGKEEQYAELSFETDDTREYEPDLDDLWGDAFEVYDDIPDDGAE